MDLPFDARLLPAYEILGFIDRGGMGAVFRARQKSLDRAVAIKVLDARLEADASRQRFLQEAHLAARLLHPNIVAVFDAGEVEGVPYIVFELIDGETLGKRLARTGRLSVREALWMAKGIADGLAAAHAAGVVHRDLKPQNILLATEAAATGRPEREFDQPKIADFGIGKSITGEGLRTRQNLILGTPLYMSPEQAQGEELGPATDIYSLGVVLYEMLAGAPPFSGTVTAVLQAHISVTPPAITALEPDVPPSVARLLDRALEKSPVKRWPSAAELSVALNKALVLAKADLSRPRPADGVSGKTRRNPVAHETLTVTPSGSRERDTVRTDPRQLIPATKPVPPKAPNPTPERRPLASILAVALVLAAAGAAILLRAPPKARLPPSSPEASAEPPEAPAPPSRPEQAPKPRPAPRADSWPEEPSRSGSQPVAQPAKPGAVRGNRRSGLYFFPGDTFYDLIKPHNRIEFESEDAALQAGFKRPARLGAGGRRRREQEEQ